MQTSNYKNSAVRQGRSLLNPDWLISRALLVLGTFLFTAEFAKAQNSQPFIDMAKLVQQPFVDQHDRLHPFTFPSDRVTVLTINGQQGKDLVDDWALPIRNEFGENIRFFCVANLTAAPKFMHQQLKEKFQRTMHVPVILDFSGSIGELIPHDRNSMTIVVFGQQGNILYVNSGQASQDEISQLKTIIRSGLLAQN